MFFGACQIEHDRIRIAIANCREAMVKSNQVLKKTKEHLLSIKIRYFFFWKTTPWDQWVVREGDYHGLLRLAPDLISREDVDILENEWSYKRMIAEIETFVFEDYVFLNPKQVAFVKKWEQR